MLQVHFAYPQMNDVMSLVKEYELGVKDQQFELDCRMTLEVRRKLQEEVSGKLEGIDGVTVEVVE
ncbi:hypothetical protein O71_13561 [Pontibacter sp. BAB1700]|nr:hypothetical protein O71_13561 [Pontibacter sp. BAB1700]